MDNKLFLYDAAMSFEFPEGTDLDAFTMDLINLAVRYHGFVAGRLIALPQEETSIGYDLRMAEEYIQSAREKEASGFVTDEQIQAL